MKIKVLVVDDSDIHLSLLDKYFNKHNIIEIVKIIKNGKEAIDYLKENIVDLIILDIILPYIDGLGVLEYIKNNNINIPVIITTAFKETNVIRRVSEYGVKYYLLKPFDMGYLESVILNTFNYSKNILMNLENNKIQKYLSTILHDIGMPSNIKGYEYIRSAVMMIFDDPSYMYGITKYLYPNISIKHNTSIQRVERNIRHAIEISCLRGDIDTIEELFGSSISAIKSKPTNSEFIMTIVDKIRLDINNMK